MTSPREIWRHNSFIGFAVMTQKNANTILASKTATAESKEIAREMGDQAAKLESSLRKGRNK